MDLGDWYTSMSKEFLDMTTSVTRNLPSGTNRFFISTMTFTAIISSTHLVASRNVLETLQEARDPFFSSVEPSAFCPNVIQLSSEYSNVKVKMFNKGSVQLTGCTSPLDCLLPLTELCRLFTAVWGNAVHVTSIDLRLINFNASLLPPESGKLHLERVASIARATPYSLFSERPERPASCIIHTPFGKAMVYATGKCSVHANSPANVASAMGLLMSIIHPARLDIMTSPHPSARGKMAWADVFSSAMPGLLHSHPPTHVNDPSCVYCKVFGNVFSCGKLDVAKSYTCIDRGVPIAGPSPKE